jgi:hypothetical protein
MYAIIKYDERFHVALRDEDSTYGWQSFKTFENKENAQSEADRLNGELVQLAKDIYAETMANEFASARLEKSRKSLARLALTAAQDFDHVIRDAKAEAQKKAFETWR